MSDATKAPGIITIGLTILKSIIGIASPELRQLLINFVNSLRDKAKSTASPIDDIIVEVVADILGVD